MGLTLPGPMRRDLLKPNRGGVWLWLCEIVIPSETTQRFTDNTEDITYNGDDFTKMSMGIQEIDFDSEGTIPQMILQVSNVQRTMEDLINQTEGLLNSTVKLVKVNNKFLDNQISALEYNYDVLAADSDEENCTITLGVPNLLTQRFPLREYSSKRCPWATPTWFKGAHCQYAGADTECDGTYEECKSKGNQVNFGGELGLDPATVTI